MRRITKERVLNILAMFLAVACPAVMASAQENGITGAPQPAKTPSIIIRQPDSAYKKPPDAMVKNEAFQVQVDAPGAGSSITITFSTFSGTTQTLEIPETAPGSGSYLSQPITAEGGAQKTGYGSLAPGHWSRSMNGLSPTDGDQITVSAAGQTTGFRVYDTDFTMVVGENNRYFAARRNQLNDAIVTAKTLLKRSNLAPATINSLNNSLRIARGKIRLIDEMQHLIANPPARTGVGDYSGTVWWQAGVQRRYGMLLWAPDPDHISSDLQSQAGQQQTRITQQGHDAADTFMIKSLASGLYVGLANGLMVTPVYTTVTGKNIFGQPATPEEIAGAAISLAAFVATFKVVPAVADASAGAAANELSGLGPRIASGAVPTPAGGPREVPGNPAPETPVNRGALPGMPTGEVPGPVSSPAPKINGVSTEGLDSASVRALEYLNQRKVPREQLEGIAASARMAAAPVRSELMLSMGGRTRQLIANVNGLKELVVSARAAGVTEGAIRGALSRAQTAVSNGTDSLEAFGYHLDFELRAQRALATGKTILVTPDALEAFRSIAGDAVTRQVQQANPLMYRINTKLVIMEKGQPVTWSPEEVEALGAIRQMPNKSNLYMYFNDEGSQLVKVFDEQALSTADRFFRSPNRVKIAEGKATLPPEAQEGSSPSLNPGGSRASEAPANRTPKQGEASSTQQASDQGPTIPLGGPVPPKSGGGIGPDKPLGGTDLGAPGHGPNVPLGGTADLPKEAKPFDGYTPIDTSLEKPEGTDPNQATKDAAEKKVSTSSRWKMKSDDSGTTTFTSPDGQTIVTVAKLASGYLVTHYERTNAKRIADLMNKPLSDESEPSEKAKKQANQPLGEDPTERAPNQGAGNGAPGSGTGSTPGTSDGHSSSGTTPSGSTGTIHLPTHTEMKTVLRVKNFCPTPQSIRIEGKGLPPNLLQGGDAMQVGGNSPAEFPVILNTKGLNPGSYSGNIDVICTSCGPECKQEGSLFPVSFQIEEPFADQREPEQPPGLRDDAAPKPKPASMFKQHDVKNKRGTVIGYLYCPDPKDLKHCVFSYKPPDDLPFVSMEWGEASVLTDGSVIMRGRKVGTVKMP